MGGWYLQGVDRERSAMKVITINVNGIRAASRKGFFDWMKRQRADVICIQETRAWAEQLQEQVYWPRNYYTRYVDAQKKGYSGVAIISRARPDRVQVGVGWDAFDDEARYLQFDFGRLSVVSLYFPSGSSSERRQDFKFVVMDFFADFLRGLRRRRREYILCGDWNIAHKKIDIRNWRSNQNNSGFLPQERAWMDELFGAWGFVDAFRQVDDRPDQYTWWSNRGQAWAKNVGWRIDYQVITPGLAAAVQRASIYKNKRFSDHAPLSISYNISY